MAESARCSEPYGRGQSTGKTVGQSTGKAVDFGNPLCVATKLAIHCIDCQNGVLFDGNAQGLLVGVGQFGIESQISKRFT